MIERFVSIPFLSVVIVPTTMQVSLHAKLSAGLGVVRASGRACTEPTFWAFFVFLRAFLQFFSGLQAAA